MENLNNQLSNGTLLRNGTYRVERHLGSGGFGNTYLVRHLGLDAEMVVKEFFMKGINMRDAGNTVTVSVPDNRATFENQREKFKKEAQRLWKLKSDYIVGVHDIFEENGTVYYSMDFVEGTSLEERIKRQGAPLSEREVRGILNQLLDALSVIHGNSPTPLFHLDIKPANILQRTDGSIVLIDFGASKQLSANRDGVSSTLMTYTRGYAPTEQIDGRPELIGAWTDLYAVGATMYRLLTTHWPPEPSDIINEGEATFQFPALVSGQMRQLIVWMMHPSRRKRPQSVAEVRDFLRENESEAPQQAGLDPEETIYRWKEQPRQKHEDSEESILAPKSPKPKRNPSWKPPYRTLGIAFAVVIVGLIIGLIINASKSSHSQTLLGQESTYETDTIPDDNSSIVSSGSSQTITVNGVSFRMIRVEGGTFMMGATSEQGSDAEGDEKPAHRVTLSSYYIGETEVTQALWTAVMGNNPSYFKGDNRPVEQVNWNDCKTFIDKLNSMTGKTFRLPTEAEWEFAARGGTKSQGHKYSGSNNIEAVAWYTDNSGSETHPVKTKSPNELGIYDMTGNVWEWCADWYNSSYYGSSPQSNPSGPSSGSDRVTRGGSWYFSARYCRVSRRNRSAPGNRDGDLGLRLVL